MSDFLQPPWAVAHQAPLSMGFSRQEYGVGCHSLLQGIFLTQRSKPGLLHWQADSLPLSIKMSLTVHSVFGVVRMLFHYFHGSDMRKL